MTKLFSNSSLVIPQPLSIIVIVLEIKSFNIDDIKKEKSIFELKKLLSSIRKSVAVNERMPKNKMQFNFHRESNDIENDDLSI